MTSHRPPLDQRIATAIRAATEGMDEAGRGFTLAQWRLIWGKAAAREAYRWETIDSAPRDGRQFLAVRDIVENPGYSMSVAAHMPNDPHPWLANMTWYPDGAFQEIWTHWTDLPAPPRGTQ